MTSSTLALETPSSLARSAANSSIALSRCALTSSRTSFSAARSLAWLTPRSLARALSFSSRMAAAVEAAWAAGAGPGPGRSVLQRGAQLGLGDAELGRRGRRGRAGRPVLVHLVERGADLGLVDAELLGELVGEGVAHVAAAAVAAQVALALALTGALVERGLDLGLGDPELRRERLLERVAEVVELAALRRRAASCSAARSLSSLTPSCLAASASASRGPPRKWPARPGPPPKP